MNNFLDKIKKQIPVPKSISFNHAGIDIGFNHVRHVNFIKKKRKTRY